MILTHEEAINHCRAEDDDPMVDQYARAAELAAQEFLDRFVYASDSDLQQAIAAVPGQLTAADATFKAAKEAAEALPELARCMAMEAACRALEAARSKARRTYDGIVVTDDIKVGMLLTLGHMYRNREDVVAGASAGAVELPIGAKHFLWPHRVVGV